MTVEELTPYLKEHWLSIRQTLLEGTYKPHPVRRSEIPKDSGGMRKLGIPTVLDRFIQQAVMQVLQEDWDRIFSAGSYGFRPSRNAARRAAVAPTGEFAAVERLAGFPNQAPSLLKSTIYPIDKWLFLPAGFFTDATRNMCLSSLSCDPSNFGERTFYSEERKRSPNQRVKAIL